MFFKIKDIYMPPGSKVGTAMAGPTGPVPPGLNRLIFLPPILSDQLDILISIINNQLKLSASNLSKSIKIF